MKILDTCVDMLGNILKKSTSVTSTSSSMKKRKVNTEENSTDYFFMMLIHSLFKKVPINDRASLEHDIILILNEK